MKKFIVTLLMAAFLFTSVAAISGCGEDKDKEKKDKKEAEKDKKPA